MLNVTYVFVAFCPLNHNRHITKAAKVPDMSNSSAYLGILALRLLPRQSTHTNFYICTSLLALTSTAGYTGYSDLHGVAA